MGISVAGQRLRCRFIYARPKEDYLRLEGLRDVIEWQLDDVYDVSGWDLQKMLRLLHKSNPTIFEWASSPIVYWTTEEWKTVAGVIGEYFRLKPCLWMMDKGTPPPIPELNAYIDANFEKTEAYLKETDDSHRADRTRLNEVFLKLPDA